MIGDEDVYAILVSASTFELVDAGGNIVANLTSTPSIVANGAALEMNHLDPTMTASELAWSTSNPAGTSPGSQRVWLTGPTAAAPGPPTVTPPGIRLDRTSAFNVQSILLDAGIPAALPASPTTSLSIVRGSAVGSSSMIGQAETTQLTGSTLLQLNGGTVALGTGAAGVALNGRPVRLLVAVQTARTAGQNLAAAAADLVGAGFTLNGLIAGDIAVINVVAGFAFNPAPAVGDLGIVYPRVNATLLNGTSALASYVGTPTQRTEGCEDYLFTVPASGNYTFQLQGFRTGAGGVIAVDGNTQLVVQVFAAT